MKLKTLLFGTLSVVFFAFGILVLNENLKYYFGYVSLISGLCMAYITQKQSGGDIMKKKEPLFQLDEAKEQEKELSTDEKIEKFGTDIKDIGEDFAKERDNELKRLKKEYFEINKLKTAIEKNVLEERKQYIKIKESLLVIENMAKSKGVLIEHKK